MYPGVLGGEEEGGATLPRLLANSRDFPGKLFAKTEVFAKITSEHENL